MKGISQLFKDAIKQCNVFSASVSLRYDLDPDYNTLTGAFITISLTILLVSVFYSQWMALLRRQAISSSTQIIRQFDPTYMKINSDNFMFTLGIEGLNLSDSTSFFDLSMKFINVTNTPTYKKETTYLALQPCTVHHWQQLGDAFVQTYYREGLSKFMCAPRNLSIMLQGKFTSENFIYYKISVNKCKKNCRPQAEFDAWIAANGTFSFNFYFSNTLLNPDQVVPITTFFQDKEYTIFSTTLYTQTNIYVRDYLMQTDNSIFPWTAPEDVTGFIVDLAEKQDFVITAGSGNPYAAMYIRKSDTSLQISRSFRKIDDMLSYIGGLFGIIVAALGFILKYYHRCAFELQMAQNYFDYHNRKNKKQKINQKASQTSQLGQSSPNFTANYRAQDTLQEDKQETQSEDVIEPKQFGFLDFLMHLLYLPLNKIFGCHWKRMDIYEDSLKEIKYKLDISQLLSKMAFYDRSFHVLFDEHQLKLLYLQDKFNFQEVRKQREMLQMRHQIIANIFGMLSDRKQNQQTPQQQKKSLNQIAQQRSHQRINTFMGQPINVFDVIPHAATKQTQQFDSQDTLPDDIKYALKKLDQKIQKGDPISIRIYNNLQYQILEAFQRSKIKKTKHRVAVKRPPSRRIKMPKKQEIKGDRVMVVNFANQESAYEMSSRGLN